MAIPGLQRLHSLPCTSWAGMRWCRTHFPKVEGGWLPHKSGMTSHWQVRSSGLRNMLSQIQQQANTHCPVRGVSRRAAAVTWTRRHKRHKLGSGGGGGTGYAMAACPDTLVCVAAKHGTCTQGHAGKAHTSQLINA
jgi:hypothetical protein